MKYILTVLLLFSINCYSQDFGEHFKKSAIEIANLDTLSNAIYDSISNFELIMVGEFHGTQEPAKFVAGLSNLISKKEGAVCVGLEIPKNELSEFIQNPSKENLLSSKFFSKTNVDGRNGQSWFDLVMYCTMDSTINLFFFDNSEPSKGEKRDSIMYVGVKNQKKLFPNTKIITLTGNIHNWRVPFNEMTTMGMYCLQDTLHFSSSKICNINHVFSEGTMRNNTGNGLELNTIEFEESVMTQSVNFTNYLVLYNYSGSRYNGILYTRKVNQSNIILNNTNIQKAD